MYGWHVSTVGDLVGHDLTRLVEPWYVYSDISMITALIINNDISTKKKPCGNSNVTCTNWISKWIFAPSPCVVSAEVISVKQNKTVTNESTDNDSRITKKKRVFFCDRHHLYTVIIWTNWFSLKNIKFGWLIQNQLICSIFFFNQMVQVIL